MKKIIFVTGASSGIGRALSVKFANSGWRVLASARRLDLLKKLDKESIYSNSIIPIKMDISNKKTVSTQVNKTIKKYGIPDIVLLNAGTNNPNSKNIFSIEETEQIFKINFFGTLNCLHALLPFLKKKNNSQVIFMSSVAGYRGLPYAAAYCSSKSAITTFAESIYNQCKNLGIAIRVINPGFVKTPLTDKNKFKMPMIIPAKKAADIMYKKIVFSKQFEINCPWLFCLIMKVLRILPNSVYFSLTQLLIKRL
ncbi:MAG: oxidoreductase [Alphaproteobacteria bacterium]|nr:MAG: oxidoreductase [Alphaproteobacteria bacterium]